MKIKIILLTVATFALFFWTKQVLALPGHVPDNSHREQGLSHMPVCPGPANQGTVLCHARVVTDAKGGKGKPKVEQEPKGYGPAELRGAYGLSGQAPNGQIIGIIAAYDHPRILNDLNTYSDKFDLPRLPACKGPIKDSPVACFQKVDQNGGTQYPRTNAGWALEIALDVEVAHAICENCSLLLVEADSNSYYDLMAAFDQAVALGANAISNSYGSNEFAAQTIFDDHFNLLGKAVVFSAGNDGFGANYPASSSYVTAVGGTTLYLDDNQQYSSETAWSGGSSGCSLYEPKPAFQTEITDSLCPNNRMVADVSAVADPNTGAAVYSSIRYLGKKGWFKMGGTSLAAPIVAGVYALSGGVAGGVQGNSLPYINNPSQNLHDIVSGSNGNCDGTYLCTALFGYDGPSGLGTPKGINGF